ncbi:thiamine pyrophosphate-binding protein [Streptomyces sp. MMS24-I29]|uniref:thiamine pyrophosphate-binding protein n=1 Tax=Streptomyces sp. MMS24-I29 TaxID=3351480 RepID=UPI003C7C26EB
MTLSQPRSTVAADTTVRRHGGHVVAQVLEEHGITQIFGQDSPELLFAVLDHSRFKVITMRDERSAGFAADAAARLTGRPAVATGIHGPGALNLTTALFEAREASSPVIALISGIETTTKGTGAFQEADHVAAAKPLVKWAARVERPDRVRSTLEQAIRVATSGRPGPVLVELPNDVLAVEQPAEEYAAPPVALRATPADDRVVAELSGATAPVLLLGSGALRTACEDLVALAERLDAAVCVTHTGRGAFPETHPLFAGVCGFMSDREDGSGAVANAMLAAADVVLALGAGMDGVTTDGGRLPAAGATLVRVDVDAGTLALDTRAAHIVLADVTSYVPALTAALPGAGLRGTREALARKWAAVREAQRDRIAAGSPVIRPSFLMGALQQALRPDDLLVCDAAYSSVWALSYLTQGEHFHRITYGRAAGTLGFGFPGAIGASVAYPDRRVVALVGDGGFGFTWGELETAARIGANITCVVLNNSLFAYQVLWHELNGTHARNLEFVDVHHDVLATAVGGHGVRVESRGALLPALRDSLDRGGLSVVDVVLDPHELPPFRKERHVDH